jgi:hypothetical protein
MKKYLRIIKTRAIDFIQKTILSVFSNLIFLVPSLPAKQFSIIGIDYSNILFSTKKLLTNSYSVNLFKVAFFSDNTFDYGPPKYSNRFYLVNYYLFYRPYLLARLVKSTDIFVYVGKMGLCFNIETDLIFIKKHKKKVVFSFVGSDVRSFYLLSEFYKIIDYDNKFSYFPEKQSEDKLKKFVDIVDKYADMIINSKIDQMSYFKKKTMPFLYYLDPIDFGEKNIHKFDNLNKVKILHAPTSFIAKGTPLVRAAIKKLKLLGYDFEYIEVTDLKHIELTKLLNEVHIVLGEFYSFVPGILAIEALFSYCAVISSANPEYEDFPEYPDKVWIYAGYWEVFDKLKYCLDNSGELIDYAERGYNYAIRNYSIASARLQFENYCHLNNIKINI